jgi:phage terminase small subunit
VLELAKGNTLTQAAKNAGYSQKYAGRAGYQAPAQLRGRVPELLEKHGLGEEVLIEKYLKPLLEAHETKFFNEGKTRINVEALGIRHAPPHRI